MVRLSVDDQQERRHGPRHGAVARAILLGHLSVPFAATLLVLLVSRGSGRAKAWDQRCECQGVMTPLPRPSYRDDVPLACRERCHEFPSSLMLVPARRLTRKRVLLATKVLGWPRPLHQNAWPVLTLCQPSHAWAEVLRQLVMDLLWQLARHLVKRWERHRQRI